jgi:hypothetical protein
MEGLKGGRKMRVVILVEGGAVQGVYASDSVELEIVDMDDLKEEGKGYAARERILKKAIEGMKEVG